jgi:carboxyl-terminal processing protease
MAAARGRRRGAAAILACVLAWPAVAQGPQALETFDAAWRIVRDSHFDTTLNGVDWDGVAAELRPRAAAAGTAGELRTVLREMLARLGQSHFSVIPATADTPRDEATDLGGTPGFDVRLAGGDLLVTTVDPGSAAAAAGVHPGWEVRAVDGLPVSAVVGGLAELLEPRLLRVEAWRAVQGRLRGPAGTKADITFADGSDATVRLSLERRAEAGQPVKVGHLPTMFVRVEARAAETPGRRAVGIIRFNVWMAAVDPLFQQAVARFRGADGLIVDLRGNPGGLAAMLMGISGHFIDERAALGVMKTRDSELRFTVNPRRVDGSGRRVQPFAGPLAILVDDLSGRASECFTGGMQALGRARVFGERSMGQALPALFSRLPNGDVLIHAYGDFVTADGTRLEGRGVVPDEVVPLAREHLLAGRDRPVDAALAWIDAAARGRAAPGTVNP